MVAAGIKHCGEKKAEQLLIFLVYQILKLWSTGEHIEEKLSEILKGQEKLSTLT